MLVKKEQTQRVFQDVLDAYDELASMPLAMEKVSCLLYANETDKMIKLFRDLLVIAYKARERAERGIEE